MDWQVPVLAQIVCATLIGGVLSVFVAAAILMGLPRRWLSFAVSFSTGLLLTTALLHLLPEALESGRPVHDIFALLLAGILGFFALEKFALWRHAHQSNGDNDAHPDSHHCHDHTHGHHHVHGEGATLPILIGDGFHNFTDGLLLAAAFLADPALGWSATVAIISHEVPQEGGDFALLLAAGWERRRALFWNAMSSLTAVAGGIVGYYALADTRELVPYIITLAAASFLYIAVADLMPRLKRDAGSISWHGVLLLLGITVAIWASGGLHATGHQALTPARFQ